MRFVWATFHYPPVQDGARLRQVKPRRRLCVVRQGMIKGPDHTGFVPAGRRFRQHFRVNDPLPLHPEDSKRLLEKLRS